MTTAAQWGYAKAMTLPKSAYMLAAGALIMAMGKYTVTACGGPRR